MFSLVVASGSYSLVAVCGILFAVVFLVWSTGSRVYTLDGSGTQAVEPRLRQLWHMGLVALGHVGSSWIRDHTYIPCIGRQILNHWTTREVLVKDFK